MNYQTLYQYGTLALMVPGLFKGTKSLNDILKHGDTGIGTADSLDGELIVLNGQGYQVKGSGKIQKLTGMEMVPFADVHFAHFTRLNQIQNINKSELADYIFNQNDYQNIFFAVKIHGVFSNIHTRSVNKANEPYPTLVEMADKQATFDATLQTRKEL
ncbi:hypothetical protein WR164_03610 [Philodulcilactobacillus myokoensis]|uniref:Alpha-acetolactate decarboxylase n=1 Tax=Philodulcilactobacillus myokoensis TaxID=2929573 RepID=A0A9W6AZR2_9LACO|nr:acetolactate decarboxylase [Philodulcilactobacillus myokoensis]GLB46382.1 hypothetical protein WR164_03610 [Philodulcilactobacillus myokoensis]